MRVAITGGTGLLGTALAYELADSHEVFLFSDASAIEYAGCKGVKADVTGPESIAKAMAKIKPDVIVHAAALTGVDYCEEHPHEARLVNVKGTANTAAACKQVGANLIHISTDYVFDGEKPGGRYTEADEPNPLGVYAQTKLDAEAEVTSSGCDYCILRTTIYGWNVRGKKNYAMFFYDAFKQAKEAPAFSNQFNSPMLANDVASIISRAMDKKLSGLYNAGCADRASRVEFAKELANAFRFEAKLIKPVVLTREMLKARRPSDVSLDSSKLEHALGRKMPSLAQGIARFKKLHDEGYMQKFRVVEG